MDMLVIHKQLYVNNISETVQNRDMGSLQTTNRKSYTLRYH